MTTNRRFRSAVTLAAVVGIVLPFALAAGACGDEIRLRSSVRLPADRTEIRLSDVATLEGDDARALGGVVLLELDGRAADRPVELPIARIRARLDDAGAHWGRVNLVGRLVVVRPSRDAGRIAAMTSAEVAPPSSAGPATQRDRRAARPEADAANADPASPRGRGALELAEAPTVLGGIVRRMLADLADPASPAAEALRPDELRIACDDECRPLAELDATGRRFDFVPETGWTSERVVVTVREIVDGRLERLGQVAFSPLQRVAVPLAAREVARGTTFTAADLRIEARWMPPILAALQAEPDAVVGRTAARRLREGEPVRRADAKAPIVVRRGDLVDVSCHVGGLVITLTAEAREDGAEGDRIAFRRVGERSEFEARVVGPGIAERRF